LTDGGELQGLGGMGGGKEGGREGGWEAGTIQGEEDIQGSKTRRRRRREVPGGRSEGRPYSTE